MYSFIANLISSGGNSSSKELGSLQVLNVANIEQAYTIESTIPVNKNGILDSFERMSDESKTDKNIRRIIYDGTIPTELKI
jgi:hypothetical protein